MFLHLDCQHYLGDRPCKYARLCEGCPHYLPMGPRWLIIKLGALGDVVRTACLLPGLAAMEEPPHVTWITSPAARPLVERMPGVHRVLTFEPETLYALEREHFDFVVSLDKEAGPCALAERVNAETKLGVGLSRYGTPYPINEEAEYYFQLGLDDEEKFHRNQKSYQQLVYEALGLSYGGQCYSLEPTTADRKRAGEIYDALDVPAEARLIALNPGAGGRFANKAWPAQNYAALIEHMTQARDDVAFVLMGGSDEASLLEEIAKAAKSPRVFCPGTGHELGTFMGLIERCDVLIAGDTLAMHLGIALGRRIVALFGPTCHQEIDLFERGTKLVSPIDCAPCYRRTCEIKPNCQDMITVKTVMTAVEGEIENVE